MKKIALLIVFSILLFPQIVFAKERVITICKEDQTPINLSLRENYLIEEFIDYKNDEERNVIDNLQPGESYTFDIKSKEQIINDNYPSVFTSEELSEAEMMGNLYDVIVKDIDKITVKMSAGHCSINNFDIDFTSIDSFLNTNIVAAEFLALAVQSGEIECRPFSQLLNGEVDDIDPEEAFSNLEFYKNNKLLCRINMYKMTIEIPDDVTFEDNFIIDVEKVLKEMVEKDFIDENTYNDLMPIIGNGTQMHIHLRDKPKDNIDNPLTSKSVWILSGLAIAVSLTISWKKKKKDI